MTLLTDVPSPEAIAQTAAEAPPSMPPPIDPDFTFEKVNEQVVQITANWVPEVTETQRRRNVVRLSGEMSTINSIREGGSPDLAQGENLFIPIRTVDTNVRSEIPPYINYFQQSARVIVLSSNDGVTSLADIEDHFTSAYRYLDWQVPHHNIVDGAIKHGWAWFECGFDANKPGGFYFDYVPHEELSFPVDLRNHQASKILIRDRWVAPHVLRSFVTRFGWNSAIVEKAIENAKTSVEGLSTTQEPSVVCIQKVFLKHPKDGLVYVAYMAKNCDAYLSPPAKLFVGRVTKNEPVLPPEIAGLLDMSALETGQTQQMAKLTQPQIVKDFETSFPLFRLDYLTTEEPRILDRVGRVFLDEPSQEASTALASAYMTSLLKSTKRFVSLKENNPDGGSLTAKRVQLGEDEILDAAVTWTFPPAPDPSTLQALQWFDVKTAAQGGQLAAAVNNRKDSRKTAKEVQSAERQEAKLNTVQLTMLSTWHRLVLNLCFAIYASRVRAGLIEVPYAVEKLNLVKDIQPAGDIDVVKREEALQTMSAIWPEVKNLPIAGEFFAEMLELSLPGLRGNKYAALLRTGVQDIQRGALTSTAQLLMSVVNDPATGVLRPEFAGLAPQLAQVQQQIQQAMQQPQQANAPIG